MKYGFIIDNRKCIGCHACTTACKAEHDVPLGVNRPCVEICPVEALYYREDGIVDFDKRRCIGCKSCMQACPYDALYIDPESHTAAKCNYCAQRIDIGLEPACVNVCPEHAIISGDMDDPATEIAQLLAREQVTVRKAAKGTAPNLFYIQGDEASLTPGLTQRDTEYFWNAQSRGVGHYAKAAEKMAFSNGDVVEALMQGSGHIATAGEVGKNGAAKSIDLLLGKPRRIYDTPDKGVLWGWEVPAYLTTKAVSAGVFLMPVLAILSGAAQPSGQLWGWVLGTALLALAATGAFLVKDLDRPDRFFYVLLRPQKRSWLVRGGYGITVYGGLLTLLAGLQVLGLSSIASGVMYLSAVVALFVAVYTAFLFAQAKGRDFWQSPTLVLHMLVHSIMAGAAAFAFIGLLTGTGAEWQSFLSVVLLAGIGANLLTIFVEMAVPHPTADAKAVADMILHGRYRNRFWLGTVLLGNVLPAALLLAAGTTPLLLAVAGALVLTGIYLTERIWVEAPQRVALV